METIMSNSDHVIDYDVVERIKASGEVAEYPGWNFFGNVFFKDNKWYCNVWQYGSVTDLIVSDTIENLKSEVCSRYGND